MEEKYETLNFKRNKFYCLDNNRNNALYCFGRINSDITQLVNLIKINIKNDDISMSQTLLLIKYLLLALKEALKFISNVTKSELLMTLVPHQSKVIINELSSELVSPEESVDSFNARILSKIRDDIAHYSIISKQTKNNAKLNEDLIKQDKNMMFKILKNEIEYEFFTDILFIYNLNEVERTEMFRIAERIMLLSKQVLRNHIKNNIRE